MEAFSSIYVANALGAIADGARALWGHATRALGFPAPSRDAEWLSRARRTPADGWLLQLTDAPLDLDKPDHLAALLRAYERFPEIGGR
ncbi:hypothetical protein D7Y21_36880 [Corallococcus sp. AB045]|nr:hypothetical protein D7Y21_36880 [Corallococcus sp. AB045]